MKMKRAVAGFLALGIFVVGHSSFAESLTSETMPVSAVQEGQSASQGEIGHKIEAKYALIRLMLTNRSGRLLKISPEAIYLEGAHGDRQVAPSY